jgi:hypothetical protein
MHHAADVWRRRRTFDSQTRVYRSVSGSGTSSHIVRKSDLAAIHPLMPASMCASVADATAYGREVSHTP